jgi:hypothetical protein
MQRGLSKYGPLRSTAVLTVTTALSCGTGIRDGEGEVYANRIVGQEGLDIQVGEATLSVGLNSLRNPPTLISLRRFATIDHSGAVGPVFEVEIPTPDAFSNDPRIVISTLDTVASLPSSAIGYLVPGVSNEQWVPDSPSEFPPCTSTEVCGPVQIQEFIRPAAGTKPPTTRLEFAIVKKCDGIGDCGPLQACSSRACQACQPSSECNPASP